MQSPINPLSQFLTRLKVRHPLSPSTSTFPTRNEARNNRGIPIRLESPNAQNGQSALKGEISCLVRRKLKAETEAIKKASSHYRSEIAELKHRNAALEQQW